MGEFMCKHPIVTLLIAFVVCGTVSDCVRYIRNPVAAKEPGFRFTINTKKGEEKGA